MNNQLKSKENTIAKSSEEIQKLKEEKTISMEKKNAFKAKYEKRINETTEMFKSMEKQYNEKCDELKLQFKE